MRLIVDRDPDQLNVADYVCCHFLLRFEFLVDLMFVGRLQIGQRPIHVASKFGHLDVVRLILDCDPQQLNVANIVCCHFSITFLISC